MDGLGSFLQAVWRSEYGALCALGGFVAGGVVVAIFNNALARALEAYYRVVGVEPLDGGDKRR